MPKMILAIATLIFSCVMPAVAQEEDSTRYINGLPVSEDDTAQNFSSRDMGPRNKVTPVAANKLPRKVLKVLEKEEPYLGWQDTIIYFEENTGLYLVPIKQAEGVKIFGLNENGNLVTFDEVTPPADQ